jgi:hypothetical protein
VAKKTASTLLRQLENKQVAPKGECVVDVEHAATADSDAPEPVLLLTNAALYARAASARDWARLPIHRIGAVQVSSDRTGMLTRYSVVDDAGQVQVDVALPLARDSFRECMESLAERAASAPLPAATRSVSGRRAAAA